MPHGTILCDFDGTIADIDVTDALLERFADGAWRNIEADWRAGRIGSRQCMSGQVALMDAAPEDLDELIDGVAIDRDFAGFVSDARRMQMHVQVVSDGLDYAISRILARHGLRDLPITANRLHYEGARRWSMGSPHARDACRTASGTCKCAVARDRANTVLVGDGQSDFCVAAVAAHVFAKGRLAEHCQMVGIAHHRIHNFSDARVQLLALAQSMGSHAAAPESFPLRVNFA